VLRRSNIPSKVTLEEGENIWQAKNETKTSKSESKHFSPPIINERAHIILPKFIVIVRLQHPLMV
jgi:hypothetical protein